MLASLALFFYIRRGDRDLKVILDLGQVYMVLMASRHRPTYPLVPSAEGMAGFADDQLDWGSRPDVCGDRAQFPVFESERLVTHEEGIAAPHRGNSMQTSSAGTFPDRPFLIGSPVALRVFTALRFLGATSHLHFDHIIPYSRGGSSKDPKKIQILCGRTTWPSATESSRKERLLDYTLDFKFPEWC